MLRWACLALFCVATGCGGGGNQGVRAGSYAVTVSRTVTGTCPSALAQQTPTRIEATATAMTVFYPDETQCALTITAPDYNLLVAGDSTGCTGTHAAATGFHGSAYLYGTGAMGTLEWTWSDQPPACHVAETWDLTPSP